MVWSMDYGAGENRIPSSSIGCLPGLAASLSFHPSNAVKGDWRKGKCGRRGQKEGMVLREF